MRSRLGKFNIALIFGLEEEEVVESVVVDDGNEGSNGDREVSE